MTTQISVSSEAGAVMAEDSAISTRMEKAAEVLADGGRQWQAADAAGVDIRTVQRWCNEPQFEHFQMYTVQIRRSMSATRAAKRERVIRMALDTIAEVLSGERARDDPRAAEAADILRETEWRTYQPDDRPRGVGPSGNASRASSPIYDGGAAQ